MKKGIITKEREKENEILYTIMKIRKIRKMTYEKRNKDVSIITIIGSRR